MYKNKISAVYKIVNTVTNDCYVGSSKDVRNRWACHKCLSVWRRYSNSPLYLDMQKYGLDKFSFQILAPVEPEHLKQVEQEFIEILEPAYNNNRANGFDVKRWKETQRKYWKEYSQSEKHKKYQKEYYNQICSYNGKTVTLRALIHRFRRAGVKYPTKEAKKYLLNQ